MAGPGNLPVGAEPDNVGTPVPHGPPRYLGPPTKSHLAQVGPYVEKKFLPQLHPWRRGTLITQGPTATTVLVAGVGEQVADGYPYDVLCTYSSPTVGALGGPRVGDDLHMGHTGTEKQYIAGYFPKKGTIPAPLVIPHLEHGTVSATVTSGNWVSQSVTFGTSFLTAPSVTATVVTTVLQVTTAGASTQAITISRSTTGAVIGLYNPTGASLIITADWIAVGI